MTQLQYPPSVNNSKRFVGPIPKSVKSRSLIFTTHCIIMPFLLHDRVDAPIDNERNFESNFPPLSFDPVPIMLTSATLAFCGAHRPFSALYSAPNSALGLKSRENLRKGNKYIVTIDRTGFAVRKERIQQSFPTLVISLSIA